MTLFVTGSSRLFVCCDVGTRSLSNLDIDLRAGLGGHDRVRKRQRSGNGLANAEGGQEAQQIRKRWAGSRSLTIYHGVSEHRAVAVAPVLLQCRCRLRKGAMSRWCVFCASGAHGSRPLQLPVKSTLVPARPIIIGVATIETRAASPPSLSACGGSGVDRLGSCSQMLR